MQQCLRESAQDYKYVVCIPTFIAAALVQIYGIATSEDAAADVNSDSADVLATYGSTSPVCKPAPNLNV